MSTRKKPEPVVNVAAEMARIEAAKTPPATDEPMVDLGTIPNPADTFPEGFHAGVQEGHALSSPSDGVDERAFATAQADMEGDDGPQVDITPVVGDMVRVSYHKPTGQYCQFNPAHTQRSDFEIRRVHRDDLHKMNLVA